MKNLKAETRPIKKAFTLAEVLIGLVVIGVIAAITVPTLIQNTQKQEFVSGLKKAYSTLSQVTNQIIAEEGSPKSSCKTCNDGWAVSIERAAEMLKKHLNVVKYCGTSTGCWTQGKIKYLNGVVDANWDTRSDLYKLILADGIQISIGAADKQCLQVSGGSKDYCLLIHADLNGAKKPNQWGKDFFAFVLKEDGLYPRGCDSNYCENTDGRGCACKVLREGAMNY